MSTINLKPYIHTAHYYETDKMGVVHHSNFIRWMEEARVDFLNQLGIPFTGLELDGIFSPVVSVKCHYKHPVKFEDKVKITVKVKEFSGVKLTVSYEMYNETSALLACTGESEHCFISREGKILNIKRVSRKYADPLESILLQK